MTENDTPTEPVGRITNKTFEFRIIASGLDPQADDFESRFFDAGCDDATISFQNGRIIVDFARRLNHLKRPSHQPLLTSSRQEPLSKESAKMAKMAKIDLLEPTKVNSDGTKNSWRVGETAAFEYHCHMGHDSQDAELWYRSHQTVTILALTESGNGKTLKARRNNGEPRVYKVRFSDGFEYDSYEDEIFEDASYLSHEFSAPPKHEIDAARAQKTSSTGIGQTATISSINAVPNG